MSTTKQTTSLTILSNCLLPDIKPACYQSYRFMTKHSLFLLPNMLSYSHTVYRIHVCLKNSLCYQEFYSAQLSTLQNYNKHLINCLNSLCIRHKNTILYQIAFVSKYFSLSMNMSDILVPM